MISLVRGSYTSEPCLPTSIQSPVRLSAFPGDTAHTLDPAVSQQVQRSELDQLRRSSWSGPEVLSESESDRLSGILEDDLEKGSALTAAFVVVFITVAFFTTLITMLAFTLSVAGDYQATLPSLLESSLIMFHSRQGRVIAFSLCRGSSAWSHLTGEGRSWCDDRIFNYHFQPSIHCPCFSHIHNISTISTTQLHN